MDQQNIGRTTLAAWTHDPAEKALVLMRGESHEAGTVWALQERIFGQGGIPADLKQTIKKADHWASATDRPQFGAGGYDSWAQVRFDRQPELIHPLSGERIEKIQKFNIGLDEIKAVSLNHFTQLIHFKDHGGEGDNEIDYRNTALSFWRFGPQPPAPELGELWGQMPADTRIPDHTIWSHLDLSGAFAVSMADGEHPALMQFSFGPVQDFIAQSRTTSDLWAGSHLLARIAWEGMRVICDELGPGAILFPQLRGVPQVDLWLQEQGVNEALFKDAKWKKSATDANPLFTAALPNKFLALVPEGRADQLAQKVEKEVRNWVLGEGQKVLQTLFEKSQQGEGQKVAMQQLERQLDGFPEVHWAIVPWQGASSGADALSAFYPDGEKSPGFLGSDGWKILPKEKMEVADGLTLFAPNEGTLYPLNYDLVERTLSAIKGVRPFKQLHQEGYRCSLCGEREWLTHDRELLQRPPGSREDSLWSNLNQPSLARKGEHLCGVCAIKRLWPTRFSEEVKEVTGGKQQRFVVSTHTMALVNSLDHWRQQKGGGEQHRELRESWYSQLDRINPVALPSGLAKKLYQEPEYIQQTIRKLPALMQYFQDADGDVEPLQRELKTLFGSKPETYYALILLDGDSMGGWLSGAPGRGINYGDAFHSKVQEGLRKRRSGNSKLDTYLSTQRAVSPARHIAISSALNSFALEAVPYVVEEMFKGKLLYAGGDDVLAMVSVDDLLPCLTMLRLVYSGVEPTSELWKWLGEPDERPQNIGNGHLYLKGHLYRMMGKSATASAGAVVAHHQAPLGKVLQELRSAESRAKNSGRDSFSISLLRRSGGRSDFTGKWQLDHPDYGFESTPMGLLLRIRKALGSERLSRRAAYILQDWLRQMPEVPDGEMLIQTMGYQLERQGGDKELGREVAQHGLRMVKEGVLKPGQLKHYVSEQLGVAEFLARGGRD